MSGASTPSPRSATLFVRTFHPQLPHKVLTVGLSKDDAGFKRVKIWWTDINDEEETEFKEYEEAPMTENWLAYFAAYD